MGKAALTASRPQQPGVKSWGGCLGRPHVLCGWDWGREQCRVRRGRFPLCLTCWLGAVREPRARKQLGQPESSAGLQVSEGVGPVLPGPQESPAHEPCLALWSGDTVARGSSEQRTWCSAIATVQPPSSGSSGSARTLPVVT